MDILKSGKVIIMELLKDIAIDTIWDCLRMLPFLFAAFLLIEFMEYYSGNIAERILGRNGKTGPAFGAFAGAVPQCGFSVMAANLYAGGLITPGTLLSVFLATSDEAVLIILSDPRRISKVGMLLGIKIFAAVTAGYITDLFLKDLIETKKTKGNLCTHCGCHGRKAGLLLPAWRHTRKIFVYLLLFTGILNLCIESMGIEQFSEMLLGNTVFQPFVAAVIGFIPNCASSVILTQLYLNGAISFASVIAGLCTGTGVGVLILFKVNNHKKENAKIVGLLFIFAVVFGIVLESIGNFIGF